MGLSKRILYIFLRNFASVRVLRAAVRVHTERLNQELLKRFGNRVLSGPFEGMKLPEGSSWGEDGDKGPKLLGTYESELHESLKRLEDSSYTEVVNIGCAEGYYAVGLARLLSTATIYAFDTSKKAGNVCKVAAEINGVSARVLVRETCTWESLEQIVQGSRRPLIVADCEGAEAVLLDPSKVPSLVNCDMLIEAHNVSQPGCTALLKGRFSNSHFVSHFRYSSRQPHEIKQLQDWRDVDRWLLVNENRSTDGMEWLLCKSKVHQPSDYPPDS